MAVGEGSRVVDGIRGVRVISACLGPPHVFSRPRFVSGLKDGMIG